MADIIQIFNFLKEFNELSNPVITEIIYQIWSFNISDMPCIDEIKSVFLGHELEENEYIEVKKPTMYPCPKPKEDLIEWIIDDWEKLSVEKINVLETIKRSELDEDKNLVYINETFKDNKNRVSSYNSWIENRNIWRINEIPKEKGLNLYNKLSELYSDIKRESESVELILGDGNLRGDIKGRIVKHPILLQKVSLVFDTHTKAFKIFIEDENTVLYTSLLRVIPTINHNMLSEIIEEVEEGNYEIIDLEYTKSLFERIINIIDDNGIFVEDNKFSRDITTINSDPVLFLRKRTLGFSNFIENVIKDIEEHSNIALPDFFQTMVGKYKDENTDEIIENIWNYNGIDKDILLTLPANNEQLRIIKYLEKYGAVLVQGPPGTGKTHTIANLIGHLLSQGSSVLVTSHTEKALSVLKEKVYKNKFDQNINLQSLCISLLSSTSQKKELDEAINQIVSKCSYLDLHYTKVKIEKIEKERESLIYKSKRLTEELIEVRSLEYKDIVYKNTTISPIKASKFLNEGKGSVDYIKGKSNHDEIGWPISYEDTVFLYSSSEQVSLYEEELLKKSYPDFNNMISTIEFENKVNYINEVKERIGKYSFCEDVIFKMDLDEINQSIKEAEGLLFDLRSFEELELSIINKCLLDPVYSNMWSDVLIKIEKIEDKYESYKMLKLNDDFDIKQEIISKESLEILNSIILIDKEYPIGFFAKKEWKNIRNSIMINQKLVELKSDFIKASKVISYEVEKQDIINIVKKISLNVFDIDDFNFESFEYKLRTYKSKIIRSLSWYEKKCKLYFERVNNSITWIFENKFIKLLEINNIEDVKKHLEEILELLKIKLDCEYLNKCEEELQTYKSYIETFINGNPIVLKIYDAINNLDKNEYKIIFNELCDLKSKQELIDKRCFLIAKIREISPELADEIENRKGLHSGIKPPEKLEEAWKYFQLRNQIERIDEIDPQKIQEQLKCINNELLKNARVLAYEKAWYEKIRNQTEKQSQALLGWKNTVKQTHKTGKRTDMFKAKARELMLECQKAIPVWIMTLNRVYETFDPRSNKFDVIIIDEASQSNILSLGALYLAKKVIVVGDDEQVSPDVVGLKIEELNALTTQRLGGIPNNHLYNEVTSLYDMAKLSGFKPLMLTEHFRCLPEIIGFSNEISYNGKIKPLRDASFVSISPAIVEYRVPKGFKNEKNINEQEAEHIVSLVRAFIEIEEYNNQTIGIISMLGSNQSSYIEKLLKRYIDLVIYEERKIQCGIPSQFQGDERDIVILSLVDSPNENAGPLRLLSEDVNNDRNKKRYNVAVSRAKNQLWVVHSLNPNIDLKPEDIRLKLINYAININIKRNEDPDLSESPFEKSVMDYLLNKNYKIISQFKVGSYRIDMVIQYDNKKIAIECDGEKFHTIDNLENDLKRQAILERLGWKFIRIRGSAYYKDPDKTMAEVETLLSKQGIYPTYKDKEIKDFKENALLNKVITKASELRDLDAKKGEDGSGLLLL